MNKRKLIITTLLFSSLMSINAAAQTDVHVLDVGQGLSVLIESNGHYMLYDGGDSDKSSYVISYLHQEGVTALDYVVASHYDSDHLNGVVGALNTFPVSTVWGPDYETGTRVFESFRSVIAAKGLSCTQPDVGSQIQLGDAVIQVLAPSGSDYSDANNYSIAIRVQDGSTSFLITGDAEAESEAQMTASGLNLDSDVYVMGHHGSGTSTSWDLLQAAVPEFAVLSCGAGNSYGHPHIESMEKLEVMEIPLFRTDKQGTIVASSDGSSITWNVEPCNDYSPGDPNDKPAKPASYIDFSLDSSLNPSSEASSSGQEATDVVYWTPGGKSYHNSQECSTLSRSKTILSGSLNDALNAGKDDPCNVCVR